MGAKRKLIQFNGGIWRYNFSNQSFENIIRNGDFTGLSSTSAPYGLTTQSFTFAQDSDGGLICTATGGGYSKVISALPSNRLDEFKGKTLRWWSVVTHPPTNTQDYVVYSTDGITEVTQKVPKTGVYTDIVVTRLVATTATKLEVGISCYNAATVSGEKVYVKRMRAVKGQSSVAYQKNPVDHHNEALTHYSDLMLPNIKTAADNTAAAAAGVPLNGLYKDSTGILKIRTV
jgi:hypothetical protein